MTVNRVNITDVFNNGCVLFAIKSISYYINHKCYKNSARQQYILLIKLRLNRPDCFWNKKWNSLCIVMLINS